MALSQLGGLVCLLTQAAAYPSSMTCDFACMAQYTAGSSFGPMGIATIGNTTGDTCMIATNVPSGGYMAGGSYAITVTSVTALGQKLVSNGGTFASGMVSDSTGKSTSLVHDWTAPTSGDVTFRALCGAGGDIDEMWAAAEVMVSLDANATSTTTTTDPNATTTTTTTTTMTPASTSAAVVRRGAPALVLAASWLM
ncbi:unnamed protein product [Symbiodinium natans]|uniref:Reelin domain-containing protein n=1 Tax=Symbiodinium natans TaxID=878477 RepID=A0A812JKA7_9DINO|nr:unnamed protein product [Symbiodinium natans]